MVPTSKLPRINVMRSTKCFTPHPRWQDFLANEGCDWRFIPQHGSHLRGMGSSNNFHETPPVKNTGFSHCHLQKTFHNCWDIGLSNLQTLVCLIQWSFQPNTFFSRIFPHWCTTDPITCADYTNVTCKGLFRWQTYPQQLQQFWQTWPSDHPQSLQQCQRWYRTSCNLEPGEVILLRADNTPPFQWPTATTTETSTKTGVVRIVTLNTPKGHSNVQIQKFAPTT